MNRRILVVLLLLIVTITARAETEWTWLSLPETTVSDVLLFEATAEIPFIAAADNGLWLRVIDGWSYHLTGQPVTALAEIPGDPAGAWIGGQGMLWRWNGDRYDSPVMQTCPTDENVLAIAVSPIDPDLVLLRTGEGVYRSEDAGLI